MTEEDVKKLIADALKQQSNPMMVVNVDDGQITKTVSDNFSGFTSALIEKAPIDVERLFTIWKTSELKKTDILLVKSDNEYVSFDYANEFKELFDRLGFTPIIVTIRANDSFEIVTEEKLNAMGYFRKKEA